MKLQVGIKLDGDLFTSIEVGESKCRLEGLGWSLDIVGLSFGRRLRKDGQTRFDEPL